jgi:hypothetical protein
MQVLVLVEQGKKVVQACKEIGIPRSTFYHICFRHPEILAALQEMQQISTRRELLAILLHKAKAIELLVEDMVNKDIDVSKRLEILKMMDTQLDKLWAQLNMGSKEDEDMARDVLSGPILQPAESRFSAHVGIKAYPDLLDAEVMDLDSK